MTATNRLQTIKRLNQLPLNQLAEKLLPPDWTNPDDLSVLTLAAWRAEATNQSDLLRQVDVLAAGDPEAAMRWVTETPEGDELGYMADLDGLSPEEIADRILESLASRMQPSPQQG